MSITVTLKGGKKVSHSADIYDVRKDGSLVLSKKQKQIEYEPPSGWRSWGAPVCFPPPVLLVLVHAYAPGEWKEFK